MFLQEIRHLLCHDQCVLKGEKEEAYIHCLECNAQFNVYRLILDGSKTGNAFESSRLAKLYADWTGDIEVHCLFPLCNLPPGIKSTYVSIPLSKLVKGTRLLRLVNSAFDDTPLNPKTILDEKIIENFLYSFVERAGQQEAGNESAGTVQTLLANLCSLFTKMDLFEHYFKVLVPFVKRLGKDAPPRKEETDALAPPAYLFWQESGRATHLRGLYAPLSFHFDVVYIIIYSYMCSEDHESLANFIYDFVARVCRGYFNTSILEASEKEKLMSSVSYNKDIEMYYVVREMQNSGLDCLSLEFLEKYARLYRKMRNKFRMSASDSMVDYAFTQCFPYILFEDCPDDYYAFMAAMSQMASRPSEKGMIANAKRLGRFIKRLMCMIREFEGNSETEIFWTNDVCRMFLVSQEDLDKEVKEIFQLLAESLPRNK